MNEMSLSGHVGGLFERALRKLRTMRLSLDDVGGLLEHLADALDRDDDVRRTFFVRPGRDFSRKRKIGISEIMRMYLFSTGRTIARKEDDVLGPGKATDAAFTLARNKIKPEFFAYMCGVISRALEPRKPKLFLGKYTLLAGDGTGVGMPRQSRDDMFCVHDNSGIGYHSEFHDTVLYDILGRRFVGSCVQGAKKTNEIEAVISLFPAAMGKGKPPAIFLGDRMYGCLPIMAAIMRLDNSYFLVRTKDGDTLISLANTLSRRFHGWSHDGESDTDIAQAVRVRREQ
jgi:hypothetical protein